MRTIRNRTPSAKVLILVATALEREVPASSRFLVSALLALLLAIGSGVLSGSAMAQGKFRVPFLRLTPIQFGVTGAIATFVIVLVLCHAAYSAGGTDKALELLFRFKLVHGATSDWKQELSIAIGDEVYERRLAGRNWLKLKGLPAGDVGKKVSISVRSRSLEVEAISPSTFTPGTPIVVSLRGSEPYATPADSALHATVTGGSVVRFGPRPNTLSLSLRLAVRAEHKTVPLHSRAALEFLDPTSGATLSSFAVELPDQTEVGSEHSVSVVLSGFVPHDDWALLKSRPARVVLFHLKADPGTHRLEVGPFDLHAARLDDSSIGD